MAPAHAADYGRIEPCSLDEDVLRLGRDHGVPAAHHTGESERLLFICNDDIVGIEHAVDPVKCLQPLPWPRATNNDGAFNLVEVEGMRRVAHAEEHVVAGIDCIQDELLAEGGEAFRHDAG